MGFNEGDHALERKEKVIIADASVIVKWFVQERFTEEALKIRDDYRRRLVDIRSTSLLPFEVLNALRYNPELGQKEIEKAGNALSRYNMALYPLIDGYLGLCAEVAFKYGITLYDASYVALSLTLDRELYTADEKLIRKVQDKRLLHVSQYTSSR